MKLAFLLAAPLAGASAVAVAMPFVVVAALPHAGSPSVTGPSEAARRDIPQFLLARYMASPTCAGLPWQIVAAVGWVESRHGSGRIDSDSGETFPPIIGPALDGKDGTRGITATPASTANTGDAVWDHAVGPMQFLTSTFDAWAVHVGAAAHPSPNNAFDAIATAGRYLCGGRSRIESIEDAVRRYNNSSSYVADVVEKAITYGMTPWEGDQARPGEGLAAPLVHGGDANAVLQFALAQLGKPYEWGASGPSSYDCSGLTYAAYRAAGIVIGRTTEQQVHDGIAVDWTTTPIAPGDLVFTASGAREYGHVGLAVTSSHWIVAPHTGDVVQIAVIPLDAVEAVRRVVEP